MGCLAVWMGCWILQTGCLAIWTNWWTLQTGCLAVQAGWRILQTGYLAVRRGWWVLLTGSWTVQTAYENFRTDSQAIHKVYKKNNYSRLAIKQLSYNSGWFFTKQNDSHEWLQYTWRTLSNWLCFTFQTTVVIAFFRRYKCQIHKRWNTESNNLVCTEAKFERNISRELANRKRKTENFQEFCWRKSTTKLTTVFFKKTELSQIVCFISHLILIKIGCHLFWSFNLNEI